MKIILGSSSPWRAQIMRTIVPEFEIIAPDIDEKSIRDDNPDRLVTDLAIAKSQAVRAKVSEPAIIITSDQVVTCNGAIREKPEDAHQARYFLKSYRTMSAVCITAVVVYNTAMRFDVFGVDRATVWFNGSALTDEAIERIIGERIIFGCAGGFAAGHESFSPFVSHIHGELESVMGLPRRLTMQLIADAGGGP